MGKPLIVYSNVPAFKEWPTNFKLLFQALLEHPTSHHTDFSINSTQLCTLQLYRIFDKQVCSLDQLILKTEENLEVCLL